MSDLGFTHVALPVSQMDRSIAFYARYAAMQVIHRRIDRNVNTDVAWLSDLTRPFVIVLIERSPVDAPLLPIAHLGVACPNREQVDQLCEAARLEGILREGPHDYGHPVGYWGFLSDPDGHTLEISYGQEIVLTIGQTVTAMIQQAANAWMAGDAAAFADLFVPEGEFVVPGNCYVGQEAIRQVTAEFAATHTDVKVEIQRIITEANQAVVEWSWQDREIATGKQTVAEDAIVVDFQQGKIQRWREYIDTKSCRKAQNPF